ncbi:MAG: hypothetical protein EXS55_02810 [Candidatus Magasanikbacteria bacterium]|nr:hypothetical protein [Candidatus Magasanikbacteria bacterium]
MSEIPLKTGLTKEQKVGFILLLVFAVLTVSLGVLQIRNTMYAPFALNNTVATVVKDQINTVDALRFRDTDHDSLTDFDELYVYGTSPYLYDTFSYGISDKEVIAKGLALCPKGQDCTNATETDGGIVQNNYASSTIASLGTDPVLANPPPDILKTLGDPAQLRQMLSQAGIDKKILDSVSDNDLLIMAKQVLQSTTTVSGLQQINALVGASTKR